MLLQEYAKAFRKQQTPAEQKLWSVLHNRQVRNLKFYRQKVLGPFIVDFYCPTLKLIIEVDGGIHLRSEQITYDKKRQDWLETEGYMVLRFTNDVILQQVDKVTQILSDLIPTSPRPSPYKGEGAVALETLSPAGRGQGEG